MAFGLSVIIPAFQEESYIGDCLDSVIAQDIGGLGEVEIVVVANACTDATVERARQRAEAAAERGFVLHVLDLPGGGKAGALNAGDRLARGAIRVYLDADVTCDSGLLQDLAKVLAVSTPRYASGRLTIPRTRSWISNGYARAWLAIPFVAMGVSGCGLYATNAAGRARWGDFPPLQSDDKFVRLQFVAEERERVETAYRWPVPEGLANLLRARRRWCEGSVELLRACPHLRANARRQGGVVGWYGRLLLAAPVSAAIFTMVYGTGWLLALGAGPPAAVEWRRAR